MRFDMNGGIIGTAGRCGDLLSFTLISIYIITHGQEKCQIRKLLQLIIAIKISTFWRKFKANNLVIILMLLIVIENIATQILIIDYTIK